MAPTPHIILASTSPYRKELLSRFRLPFDVQSPLVDETPHPGENPMALALRLAAILCHARQLILGIEQAPQQPVEGLGQVTDFVVPQNGQGCQWQFAAAHAIGQGGGAQSDSGRTGTTAAPRTSQGKKHLH